LPWWGCSADLVGAVNRDSIRVDFGVRKVADEFAHGCVSVSGDDGVGELLTQAGVDFVAARIPPESRGLVRVANVSDELGVQLVGNRFVPEFGCDECVQRCGVTSYKYS